MSEGVEVARQAIAQGAELIVSRGGTYQLVKEAFPIPVVEIKVSAYDVLQSFEQVDDPNETIGVVGYSNVVDGYDLLRKLLPNPVVLVELKRESDIYAVIEDHKRRGIKTYIGDANITRIIRELNCNGIMIQSQKASIHTAIQEARRILRATKEEKRRAQQIATITDFVHDAIIAIDENEKITVYNRRAEQVFGVPQERARGRLISDVVPNTKLPEILATGIPQLGELQNLWDSRIVTNRVPITVDGEVKGAVATFQDVTEVQNLEEKIRRSMSEKGFIAKYTFDDIVYASRQIAECIKTAKKFAMYDTPIHICGASGVGKELFCQSIHNYSRRHLGPFVAVNCAAIAPSLIESEFFGYEEGSFTGARKKGKTGMFELAHNGTLFLDEISEILMELQGRLLRVLQEKQVMRLGGGRVIPIDVKIITASNKYPEAGDGGGPVPQGPVLPHQRAHPPHPAPGPPPGGHPRPDPLLYPQILGEIRQALLEPTPDVERYLLNRKYEGNIRELEGLIERCVILSSFDAILAEREAENRSAQPPAQESAPVCTDVLPPDWDGLDLRSWSRSTLRWSIRGQGEISKRLVKFLA